jgi:hypothetical protein
MLAVPTCPECAENNCHGNSATTKCLCSRCGGSGYDLPDEMVRRVTIALQHQFGHDLHPHQAKVARAALVALFDYEKGA